MKTALNILNILKPSCVYLDDDAIIIDNDDVSAEIRLPVNLNLIGKFSIKEFLVFLKSLNSGKTYTCGENCIDFDDLRINFEKVVEVPVVIKTGLQNVTHLIKSRLECGQPDLYDWLYDGAFLVSGTNVHFSVLYCPQFDPMCISKNVVKKVTKFSKYNPEFKHSHKTLTLITDTFFVNFKQNDYEFDLYFPNKALNFLNRIDYSKSLFTIPNIQLLKQFKSEYFTFENGKVKFDNMIVNLGEFEGSVVLKSNNINFDTDCISIYDKFAVQKCENFINMFSVVNSNIDKD